MEKWYYFPIQTTQNVKMKIPRRLIVRGLGRIGLVAAGGSFQSDTTVLTALVKHRNDELAAQQRCARKHALLAMSERVRTRRAMDHPGAMCTG